MGRAIVVNIVPSAICAWHAPNGVYHDSAPRVPGVRAYPGGIGKITREIDQFGLLTLCRRNMLFYTDHCNGAGGRNRRKCVVHIKHIASHSVKLTFVDEPGLGIVEER